MPSVSGSYSGKLNSQTLYQLRDQPDHQLQLGEISGVQHSDDPAWDNSVMTYWGTTDAQSGSGIQRGYFDNQHTDGGRDWGTFEGSVSVTAAGGTIEGTWSFSGGNGKYAGITGGGTYHGRMTSAVDVEMAWKGSYQLAGARTTGAS